MQHKSWVYALVNDTINSCSCQYFKSSLCCQDLSYIGGKYAQLCIIFFDSSSCTIVSSSTFIIYSAGQCLFHSTMSIPQDDHASVYYYATQYLPLVHVHIKTSTRIHHRLVEIMRLTKNSSQKFLIRYLYTPIIVSI